MSIFKKKSYLCITINRFINNIKLFPRENETITVFYVKFSPFGWMSKSN